MPTAPCVITDCGQLSPDDPCLSESAAANDSDPYEDYPDDQDSVDGQNVIEKPEAALKVAREVREIGTKLFKEGKAEDALAKYQSRCLVLSEAMLCPLIDYAESIRYLDMHQTLPHDAPPELKDSYDALLAPLFLNSALAALRAGGTANAGIALKAADRALEMQLSDADKGAVSVILPGLIISHADVKRLCVSQRKRSTVGHLQMVF